MGDPMDMLIARLAVLPADRRLDMLERSVWARIHAHASPRAAPWSWAAAGTAAALMLGVAVGGGAAARAADPAALVAETALAPSTLLDGQR